MLRRQFTFDEWFRFSRAAARVRDEVNAELGELLLRVSKGDDSALADVHDRLNVLGNFAGADQIRRLVLED
jgi:uncharacterized NAD(P)/FAD-binding protein YdhS